ncbi:MAG: hypothetical protein IIZ40_00990 [Bacilli bacterium]|nr:hypothetical protein [Bacilli bacterium]
MKKTLEILFLLLFLVSVFIILSSETNYYEYSNNKKAIVTEENIKRFEEDISNGKKIDISNYINNDSKDYSNKVTNLGDNISNLLNKTVNFVLKTSFKAIENMIN